MRALLATLEAFDEALADLVLEVEAARRDFPDDDVVALLQAAGRIGRRLEAVEVECIDEVTERSRALDRHERMTTRFRLPQHERTRAARDPVRRPQGGGSREGGGGSAKRTRPDVG